MSKEQRQLWHTIRVSWVEGKFVESTPIVQQIHQSPARAAMEAAAALFRRGELNDDATLDKVLAALYSIVMLDTAEPIKTRLLLMSLPNRSFQLAIDYEASYENELTESNKHPFGFTLGPWCLQGEWMTDRGLADVIEATDFGIIGGWIDGSNERDGNRRLIASAPDLATRMFRIVQIARDVIANSKFRDELGWPAADLHDAVVECDEVLERIRSGKGCAT